MSDTDKMVLDINTDTFNSFKSDFNNILTAVLQNMQSKELTECDMAMNLNIKFTEDGKRPGHFIMPELRHEIKATFKQTTKKTGSLAPAHTELVYDEDSEQYVLQRMDDGQQDIFAGAEKPKEDADVINVTPALPEPEPKALPENISDVDTTSPCKTCVNYKDGQPCGIECDAEYSGYEPADEDEDLPLENVTAADKDCRQCIFSKDTGFPDMRKKQCVKCGDDYDNFVGKCFDCRHWNEKESSDPCPGCSKTHGKWEKRW